MFNKLRPLLSLYVRVCLRAQALSVSWYSQYTTLRTSCQGVQGKFFCYFFNNFSQRFLPEAPITVRQGLPHTPPALCGTVQYVVSQVHSTTYLLVQYSIVVVYTCMCIVQYIVCMYVCVYTQCCVCMYVCVCIHVHVCVAVRLRGWLARQQPTPLPAYLPTVLLLCVYYLLLYLLVQCVYYYMCVQYSVCIVYMYSVVYVLHSMYVCMYIVQQVQCVYYCVCSILHSTVCVQYSIVAPPTLPPQYTCMYVCVCIHYYCCVVIIIYCIVYT